MRRNEGGRERTRDRKDGWANGQTDTQTISLRRCRGPEAGVLLAGELLAAGDIKRELRPNLCPRVLDGLITSHRPSRREHRGRRPWMLCAARRESDRYRKHRKLRPDYIPDTRDDPARVSRLNASIVDDVRRGR